ncbi:MAG: hypothetical protein Q9186_003659 [Xanthomendoza sp. 1 TL-2023]
MPNPREAVLSLKIKNFESRAFVPYPALDELMNPGFVTSAVDSVDIPVYRKQEVVRIVLTGAKKIFAILLLLHQPGLIVHFIEKDQFQSVKLDYKLPFTVQALAGILHSHTTAGEFHDIQWEFTSPEFSHSMFHRSLNSNTVLPFVGDPKDLGEGGFDDSSILLALCRLSSAINAVHSFTIQELDLSMIGCHHDLKPRNILVHGKDFLLADFGLARLKLAVDSSKSIFTAGPAWYLAPECEDGDDDFEKHTIGRPSDIWSFGCILTEVLTYLLEGAEGVIGYEKRRKVKLGMVTTYTFHAGRFSPNSGVLAWMLRLRQNASVTAPHLVALFPLFQRMLAIPATERPSAVEVMLNLEHVYISVTYRHLLDTFESGLLMYDDYEMKAEYERFRIWGLLWGLERPTDLDPDLALNLHPELAFEPNVELLRAMGGHLQMMSSLASGTPFMSHHAICETNDSLCRLLPARLQRKLQIRLEQELITKASAEELQQAGNALTTTPMHRRLGMLATIKCVTELAASRKSQTRPELELESGLIRCTEKVGDHAFGSVMSFSRERERRVLMEYVRYDVHWKGPVSEEMLVRIEAIAEMHSHEEKPPELRSLPCKGFFHDARQHAFALVYSFPIVPMSDSETTQVYSLKMILERSQKWKERPLLDHRYRLARTLAVALLAFHNVHWLHKSLSASHVIFFANESKEEKKMLSVTGLESPYVIGFNHSRPDEPAAFTDGPGTGGESGAYQHPSYAERKYHYSPEFDYYSLGLVILEIALWMPLAGIKGSKKFSSLEEQRRYLLLEIVPLLGHLVGKDYAAAVTVCLKEFGGTQSVEDGSEVKILKFGDEVVERLRGLSSE